MGLVDGRMSNGFAMRSTGGVRWTDGSTGFGNETSFLCNDGAIK